MTKDEALRLALEAFETCGEDERGQGFNDALVNKAITAIKSALEAKDEPVCKDCNGTGSADSGGTHPWGESIFIRCHCTYPTPPQQEAKDEPVAWEQFYPDIGKNQFAYLPPSPFSISGKPQSSQQEKNEFNPDWDTQAVLVEEIQRMAKRIEELEAKDEPVAAECKFDQEKEWGRCSVEHHNLVQSEPNKWPDYQTRLLYATPPQRKPLSDETIGNAIDAWFKRNSDGTYGTWHERMRAAIKAAHGIIDPTDLKGEV